LDALTARESFQAESDAAARQCMANLWMAVDKSGDRRRTDQRSARAREKGRHRDRAALSGLSFQAKQDAAGSGTVMPQ
jgi:hypothetical protein